MNAADVGEPSLGQTGPAAGLVDGLADDCESAQHNGVRLGQAGRPEVSDSRLSHAGHPSRERLAAAYVDLRGHSTDGPSIPATRITTSRRVARTRKLG